MDVAVLAFGKVGKLTRATHCREGETGHNVLLEGNMGDTKKSPTMRMLEQVYHLVRRAWRRWLGRRHRSGHISVEKFKSTIEKTFPLPRPRIVHNF